MPPIFSRAVLLLCLAGTPVANRIPLTSRAYSQDRVTLCSFSVEAVSPGGNSLVIDTSSLKNSPVQTPNFERSPETRVEAEVEALDDKVLLQGASFETRDELPAFEPADFDSNETLTPDLVDSAAFETSAPEMFDARLDEFPNFDDGPIVADEIPVTVDPEIETPQTIGSEMVIDASLPVEVNDFADEQTVAESTGDELPTSGSVDGLDSVTVDPVAEESVVVEPFVVEESPILAEEVPVAVELVPVDLEPVAELITTEIAENPAIDTLPTEVVEAPSAETSNITVDQAPVTIQSVIDSIFEAIIDVVTPPVGETNAVELQPAVEADVPATDLPAGEELPAAELPGTDSPVVDTLEVVEPVVVEEAPVEEAPVVVEAPIETIVDPVVLPTEESSAIDNSQPELIDAPVADLTVVEEEPTADLPAEELPSADAPEVAQPMVIEESVPVAEEAPAEVETEIDATNAPAVEASLPTAIEVPVIEVPVVDLPEVAQPISVEECPFLAEKARINAREMQDTNETPTDEVQATEDPSLISELPTEDELPSFPESFIESFVESQPEMAGEVIETADAPVVETPAADTVQTENLPADVVIDEVPVADEQVLEQTSAGSTDVVDPVADPEVLVEELLPAATETNSRVTDELPTLETESSQIVEGTPLIDAPEAFVPELPIVEIVEQNEIAKTTRICEPADEPTVLPSETAPSLDAPSPVLPAESSVEPTVEEESPVAEDVIDAAPTAPELPIESLEDVPSAPSAEQAELVLEELFNSL